MQTKSIRTRRLAALAISTVLLAGACGSSAPVGVPSAGSIDEETETTLADPSIDSTDTSDSAAGESAIDATSTTTDAAAAEAETIEPGDTGESAEGAGDSVCNQGGLAYGYAGKFGSNRIAADCQDIAPPGVAK